VEWKFQAAAATQALFEREPFLYWLRDSCTVDSDFTSAETVFGELVANVVRHAPAPSNSQRKFVGTV
jgi:hypothetical protein